MRSDTPSVVLRQTGSNFVMCRRGNIVIKHEDISGD